MTALDPSTATRVLEMPTGLSFATLAFGDATISIGGAGSTSQPVEITEYGHPAIPREGTGVLSPLKSAAVVSPPDGWTLMVAFDGITSPLSPLDVLSASWVHLATGYDSATQVIAGIDDLASTPVTYAAALDGQPVVFIISASGVDDCFFGTDAEGVLATASPMSSPSSQVDGELTLGSSGPQRILGMWMWEAAALSQVDAVDTAAAIASELSAPAPVASSIGSTYTSAAMQAIIGPNHAATIPDVLWGGWLDTAGDVVAMTHLPVPHSSFGPVANGVENTSSIDAGVLPAGVPPLYFGLFDAETGGALVAFCTVTYDTVTPPSPGDPMQFPDAALAFVIDPATFPGA